MVCHSLITKLDSPAQVLLMTSLSSPSPQKTRKDQLNCRVNNFTMIIPILFLCLYNPAGIGILLKVETA